MTSTPGTTEVLNRLPAIAFEVDCSGRCLSVNAAWSRLTGQQQADALGLGWTKAVHPDDTSLGLTLLLDLVRAPREVSFDARLLRATKGFARLRAVVRPWFDASGVVAGFTGIAVELATDEELNRAHAHTEALLAALPDMLFQVNAEGVFVAYHAPPGPGLFVPPAEFLGRPLTAVLPAPIAEKTLEAMLRARDSGLVQRYEYQLRIDALGLRDYEGRVTSMRTGDSLVLVRDVTDDKRFKAELVVAREQALASNRHKTHFLANVSHEIRTPLNGILGVTQLLRSASLPDGLHEYLEVLQSAGESLLGIVDDVLDLSKIEANRLELSTQVFDLEQVVTAAAKTFMPQAQKKGLVLDVDVRPDARGQARGDPFRLRQIVNNLLGNALKFTERGSVRLVVDRHADGLVTVTVADTGPGIEASMLQRIFEPFVQTEGTQRRYGGTGLGLSITQRLARLMNGDVLVESTLGRGTTFTARLTLPRHGVSAPARERPRPLAGVTRGLRVLLAEDNEVNATMTQALIARLGHSVTVVANGQAAVEAVNAGRFDLVIMDVEMPVLDGLAATRLIRSSDAERHRHLPIVALTANAMKGDDLVCLSAGMDAYLPKPVTVEALQDMLAWFRGAD